MNFDPNLCEQYCRMLIEHDEVERALLVLDNVPAYYRDNMPSNLVKLREEIFAACCTTHAYLTSNCDSDVTADKAMGVLTGTARGVLIKAEVERYNAKNEIPHIVDMGPGEYFVPIALKQLGLKFSYWPIALDKRAGEAAWPLIQSHVKPKPHHHDPVIFLALEVIEHLPSVQDIAIEAFRHCGTNPHRIHFSTPMYTYTTEHSDWSKPTGLPHLRAYTPAEFNAEVQKLFPNHALEVYTSQIMSIRGVRRDTPDDGPLIK